MWSNHQHCVLCTAPHSFKGLYSQLRGLKTEIEHTQHLLEKAKMQLQKDFEEWWAQQSTKGGVSVLDRSGVVHVY